jgi:hypothetical protein
MRFLLSIVLLIPAVCLAAGPDSQEYAGVTNSGKLIIIKFLSDPEEWTGNNWIYGSSSNPKFMYCWINEAPIDTTSPNFSPRQHTHLVCASARGVQPTVFYEIGGAYGNQTAPHYKDAMANFEKAKMAGYERDNDAINEYYVCDRGCDSTMPLFIFNVGYDD